ncbi:MAG: hypothetical protein K0V04_38495 [Deltaproteobacteria bacterium]|nr:hypothetical protein [Deltaproteobacteria bacterium]
MATPRPNTLILARPLALLVRPGCKRDRRKLEGFVPDGATAVVSIDGQAMVKSTFYSKTVELAKQIDPAEDPIAKLKDECGVDVNEMGAYVIGVDALSQGVMVAINWKNLGKKESLECLAKLGKEMGGDLGELSISEEGGKPKFELGGGEFVGWALDDDTVVSSTKGWSSAVQGRIKGEGKGAVDNSLKDAIALTNTSKHIWFASEIPPVMTPFLDSSPAKGLVRAAGSLQMGDDFEIELAGDFNDESRPTALKEEAEQQLAAFKGMVEIEQARKAMESVTFETDGKVLRVKASFPVAPLLDGAKEAFGKYTSRSKTSEARVNIAKMFDAASAYFNEEHVERGAVAAIGGGGTLSGYAPHRCPSDGKPEGSSGVVPPLSVECAKGPGGRCVPAMGPQTEPGYYDMSLWTDNPVFNGLNFMQEQAHYFHYEFRWKNAPTGFGECQFTAQAFADLDDDGVFSTYERSGAADKNGVNAAAGLYIDREIE